MFMVLSMFDFSIEGEIPIANRQCPTTVTGKGIVYKKEQMDSEDLVHQILITNIGTRELIIGTLSVW